jgi:hypothetical protein
MFEEAFVFDVTSIPFLSERTQMNKKEEVKESEAAKAGKERKRKFSSRRFVVMKMMLPHYHTTNSTT